MKRLISDKRGESHLAALFLVLMFCMIFVCIYNFAIIYMKADDARRELQRAATLAVDIQLENKNVRDLVFEVQSRAPGLFEDNMLSQGFTKTGDVWTLDNVNDNLLYTLSDISIQIADRKAVVSGELTLTYPWGFNGTNTLTLPVSVMSNVIYIWDEFKVE